MARNRIVAPKLAFVNYTAGLDRPMQHSEWDCMTWSQRRIDNGGLALSNRRVAVRSARSFVALCRADVYLS